MNIHVTDMFYSGNSCIDIHVTDMFYSANFMLGIMPKKNVFFFFLWMHWYIEVCGCAGLWSLGLATPDFFFFSAADFFINDIFLQTPVPDHS